MFVNKYEKLLDKVKESVEIYLNSIKNGYDNYSVDEMEGQIRCGIITGIIGEKEVSKSFKDPFKPFIMEIKLHKLYKILKCVDDSFLEEVIDFKDMHPEYITLKNIMIDFIAEKIRKDVYKIFDTTINKVKSIDNTANIEYRRDVCNIMREIYK